MKKETILNEMKSCEERIKILGEELNNETEFKTKKDKIDEMMKLLDKMSKLDSKHKKILLKEVDKSKKELFKKFRNEIKRMFK